MVKKKYKKVLFNQKEKVKNYNNWQMLGKIISLYRHLHWYLIFTTESKENNVLFSLLNQQFEHFERMNK